MESGWLGRWLRFRSLCLIWFHLARSRVVIKADAVAVARFGLERWFSWEQSLS